MVRNQTKALEVQTGRTSLAADILGSRTGMVEAGSFALLSPGELKFLRHLADGLSYEQIASGMDVTVNTVRSYVRSVYKKLCVNSRTKAVVKYLQNSRHSLPIDLLETKKQNRRTVVDL